jgi:hypothetical protein
MGKRLELLSEFMYWFFDSFIIDLVRVGPDRRLRCLLFFSDSSISAQTSFYVTDTATHQNRPLYFRQDDWTALCAPLLKQLGDSVFEKVPLVSPFRSLNGIRAPVSVDQLASLGPGAVAPARARTRSVVRPPPAERNGCSTDCQPRSAANQSCCAFLSRPLPVLLVRGAHLCVSVDRREVVVRSDNRSTRSCRAFSTCSRLKRFVLKPLLKEPLLASCSCDSCLSCMQKRKPHLTGSLVVDPQQIYAKLRLFKKDLLARHGGDKLCVPRSLLADEPILT